MLPAFLGCEAGPATYAFHKESLLPGQPCRERPKVSPRLSPWDSLVRNQNWIALQDIFPLHFQHEFVGFARGLDGEGAAPMGILQLADALVDLPGARGSAFFAGPLEAGVDRAVFI